MLKMLLFLKCIMHHWIHFFVLVHDLPCNNQITVDDVGKTCYLQCTFHSQLIVQGCVVQ